MDVQRIWILADDGDGQPGGVLSFDTTLRESHTSDLEVTENPVETGVVVADHAYMKPAHLDIDGCVGDVWLYGQDENGDPIADPFAGESRSSAAYKRLLDLQAAARPFSVQTGLRLYENMVVTSISAEQDAGNAAFLYFKASLREVIRVSTRSVTVPPRKAGPPHRKAAPAVAAGEAKSTPCVVGDGALSSCGVPKLAEESVGIQMSRVGPRMDAALDLAKGLLQGVVP